MSDALSSGSSCTEENCATVLPSDFSPSACKSRAACPGAGMPLHTSLVPTIVICIVLALAFGAIANRLKASPLVGYLLAGVVIGPFTPGFVADQNIANELSEIGIILLMFGVGLQFSLQ